VHQLDENKRLDNIKMHGAAVKTVKIRVASFDASIATYGNA